MRWTKLKSLTEEQFAPSLRGRVAIFSTRYGDCRCGRAWITVDGEIAASFCTRAAQGGARKGRASSALPAGHGEFTRQDAYAACWAFVHELSIDDALVDEDPLVQALCVLDARLGKRRLRAVRWKRLHPVVRTLLRVRLGAEGIAVPEGLASTLSS